MRTVALSLARYGDTHPWIFSRGGHPCGTGAMVRTKIPVIRTMRIVLPSWFGATGLLAPASVGAANRALAEIDHGRVSARCGWT